MCAIRMFLGVAVLWSFAASVLAIPTISTLGNKFFDSNGKQFFIKGVAYQLTPDDPLVDTQQCQRDASLMQKLGANAIRVYHVDPVQGVFGDHSGCMKAFADAGIYLFVDLDTFTTDIDPHNVTWNQFQFDSYAAVMDEFHKFDNVAGFFVGNEVIAKNDQSLAAPYIKAAARDMKKYRDDKKYRQIPIGYSATDIAELRPSLQNYLACGDKPEEAIDFFGLNAYEWCGPNDMATSGYNTLNSYIENYNIPFFFSETGCNTVKPRDFADQTAIFGPQMNERWSGAIVYEWIEEANNYGLISYGKVDGTDVGPDVADGFSRKGTPTPVSPDFSNLQTQWATLTPTGIAKSAYTPNLTPPACPSSTAGGWLVAGDVKLPSVGQILSTGAGGTAIETSDAAGPTTTSHSSSSPTGSASGASETPGSASGGKEVAGMCVALVSVMLGVMIWL